MINRKILVFTLMLSYETPKATLCLTRWAGLVDPPRSNWTPWSGRRKHPSPLWAAIPPASTLPSQVGRETGVLYPPDPGRQNQSESGSGWDFAVTLKVESFSFFSLALLKYPVVWIRIRMDPHWFGTASGGSRRAKTRTKKEQSEEIPRGRELLL